MNIIGEIQKCWFPRTLKCVYRKDILKYALNYHKYDFTRQNYDGLCMALYMSFKHYGIYTTMCSIEHYLPLLLIIIKM